MKALVKGQGKNELRIEDREIPSITENELLIKVEHCGICGSDLHAAINAPGYEFVPKPIILGHEFSGTVAEVGADNRADELLGQRVIILPGEFCGECEQCLNGRENICSNIIGIGLHKDGGMAEYVKVRRDQVILTPNKLPSKIAALTEPLSVAVHAAERVDNLTGKKVLVQGCGIIGMFTAFVAKTKGAEVTISGLEQDVEHRLRLAEELGIKTEVFRGKIDTSQKFDYIYECSGSSAATTGAVSRIKKGGALILVALYENKVELPVNLLVRGEIDVRTSYAAVVEDFYKSIKILINNKESFQKLIRIYPLSEGEQAFKDARNQKVLKPVLEIK